MAIPTVSSQMMRQIMYNSFPVIHRANLIKLTHRHSIQYFCVSTNTSTQSKPSTSSKIPLLKREYDKDTNTVSYVLSSTTTNTTLSQHNDNPKYLPKADNNPQNPDDNDSKPKQTQKDKRLATNALTEYLPSHKSKSQRDKEKELKAIEQSLMRKFGTSKEQILSQMRKNFKKQKLAFSKEIMSYFETIPKLEKLRNKFTHDEISKLLLLQQALQISPRQYKKVLKRYPYILKMDIEKEILPKLKSLQQVFPNHDTLSVFIRAPNIIASNTSTWLTRRDKINNLLGIRKDVFVNVISQQPSILFNSIIKTTGPKIRFLCDRVRSKYELQSILSVQPSILKVGWGRLARIEFLRSPAVPHQWQSECINPPPNIKNPLGDDDDLDLEDINDQHRGNNKINEAKVKQRKLRQKEREMNMEWHLNRPCVTWNHHQMKYAFPKYVNFLEEFTLRAKRNKMWTKKDLEGITTKEMEGIVGEALRQKYVRRKLVGVNWEKMALRRSQNRKLKKMRRKMSDTPSVEKSKI